MEKTVLLGEIPPPGPRGTMPFFQPALRRPVKPPLLVPPPPLPRRIVSCVAAPRMALPSLLVAGAVHQPLLRHGQRAAARVHAAEASGGAANGLGASA